MFDFSDLEYTRSKLSEKTAKVNSTLAGALGGAGLGLLTQAIRPKDKDQNKIREYILSALLGAGLGAASGYGYSTWRNSNSKKKSTDSAKNQGNGKGGNSKNKKEPEVDESDVIKLVGGGSDIEARRDKERYEARKKWEQEARDRFKSTGKQSQSFDVQLPTADKAAIIEARLNAIDKKTGKPFKDRFYTLEQLRKVNPEHLFGPDGRPMEEMPLILTQAYYDTMFPPNSGIAALDEAREKFAPYVWNPEDEYVAPTPIYRSKGDDGKGRETYWPMYITKDGYVVPFDSETLGAVPIMQAAFPGDINTTPNRLASRTANAARSAWNWAGGPEAVKWLTERPSDKNNK